MQKLTVVKEKHIKIEPRIYVPSVFELDNEYHEKQNDSD